MSSLNYSNKLFLTLRLINLYMLAHNQKKVKKSNTVPDIQINHLVLWKNLIVLIYCQQLSNLAEKLENLRPQLANRKGGIFQQDNARPYVSLAT